MTPGAQDSASLEGRGPLEGLLLSLPRASMLNHSLPHTPPPCTSGLCSSQMLNQMTGGDYNWTGRRSGSSLHG